MSRDDFSAFREGRFVGRLAEAERRLLRDEPDHEPEEQECLWPWIS